ncbi:MAG: DUF3604 domain-containing protein [bacterium]|nr:DUF3604 domain-containing protein [bacterium]
MRRSLILAVAGLVLATSAPVLEAATARRRLDAYALASAESMRLRAMQVRGGDVAVGQGRLIVRGGLDAAGRQLVAPAVRIAGAATCAAVLGDDVQGAIGTCPRAGDAPGNLVPALAEACTLPGTAAACDAARPVVVQGGAARTLAPGRFGNVVVRGAGSTLSLAAGRYVVCDLKALRGTTVRALGPVELVVAGRLTVNAVVGPTPGVALSPDDVRLHLAGPKARLRRGADVRARVCAPATRVTLARAVLRGSLVAQRIAAVRSTVEAPYAEERAACSQRSRLRHAYFGDLHVHTALSFDAQAFDVRTTPADAYRFAQGDPVSLPPLDPMGNGTQTIAIDRPLDFAAVTDHSEFLGEVALCTTPGSPVYDSASCQAYRVGGNDGTTHFGVRVALSPPARLPDVCGPDNALCLTQGDSVWGRIQEAAADAYDRSDACAFTSFVGYEYTGSRLVSTLHRNVIFRNDRVPYPTSVFEAPTANELWTQLADTCQGGGVGCDALVVPHNANESNGKMFLLEYPGAAGFEDERTQAALRSSMEPLFEVYQHKGSSECFNGIGGIVGASDEQCEFEKRRYDAPPDCGDGTGIGGTITSGCLSRRDFLRGALLEGMREQQRIGVNPLRLGVVASTDTHNGTPGAVSEDGFIGHRGTDDGTPATLLGNGQFYPGGWRFSPGGLVGVWAEENARPALFDALRRRETFGTSGPRIAVRLFGGWDLPAGLCSDPAMLEVAYAQGVPMGGSLGAGPGGAPRLLVSALADAGTPAQPGLPLQRIQIVKGWVAGGQSHQRVYDVAGDPNNGASVDPGTCATSGAGFSSLCTVWTDPDFDPTAPAFYYARVLENPRCRWHTVGCNALPPAERPASCSDPAVPRTVQERAWTSPVWYEPVT